MAAKRFISVVSGRLKMIAGIIVSAGAGNSGDLAALDATGKLDASVMPLGVGVNTRSVVCSENLAAGDVVNFYNNSGTLNARKADATAEGKEVNAFVKAAFLSGATAVCYLPDNIITGLSGLTPGARQYLHTTAGTLTETAPSTAGNVVQMIGTALSATEVEFDPEEPVTVA